MEFIAEESGGEMQSALNMYVQEFSKDAVWLHLLHFSWLVKVQRNIHISFYDTCEYFHTFGAWHRIKQQLSETALFINNCGENI